MRVPASGDAIRVGAVTARSTPSHIHREPSRHNQAEGWSGSRRPTVREAGLPRTLHEVSEKSREDVKEVARLYRLLVTELDLRMPVDDPMKLVPRLASEVGASVGTDILAVEILREATEQKALAGKDPRASAAAALYMACKARKEKCTQETVAAAAGVSEVSLRKRLRDLEEITEGKA